MSEFIIPMSFVGLLYEDGVFQGQLKPGKHAWKPRWFQKEVERTVHMVDVRERSLTLKGQEILTRDKQARLAADAERERSRAKLEGEVEEAKALRTHPELLRLRELQTLSDIAKSGGRFVVGLRADGSGSLFRDDRAE
ncbi:MAG TPA: hypothetical protein VEJ89_12490 [Myxococcaceae bacterium]|nr:hypothetical protein [Myxococcaceae bacterium]